jgi:hypothetical protein
MDAFESRSIRFEDGTEVRALDRGVRRAGEPWRVQVTERDGHSYQAELVRGVDDAVRIRGEDGTYRRYRWRHMTQAAMQWWSLRVEETGAPLWGPDGSPHTVVTVYGVDGNAVSVWVEMDGGRVAVRREPAGDGGVRYSAVGTGDGRWWEYDAQTHLRGAGAEMRGGVELPGAGERTWTGGEGGGVERTWGLAPDDDPLALEGSDGDRRTYVVRDGASPRLVGETTVVRSVGGGVVTVTGARGGSPYVVGDLDRFVRRSSGDGFEFVEGDWAWGFDRDGFLLYRRMVLAAGDGRPATLDVDYRAGGVATLYRDGAATVVPYQGLPGGPFWIDVGAEMWESYGPDGVRDGSGVPPEAGRDGRWASAADRLAALAALARGESGAQARLAELGVTDPRGAGEAWAAYQGAQSDLAAAEQAQARLLQDDGGVAGAAEQEAAAASVDAARVVRDASLRTLGGFGVDEGAVAAFHDDDRGGLRRMGDTTGGGRSPRGGQGGSGAAPAADGVGAAQVTALADYARGVPDAHTRLEELGIAEPRPARDVWAWYQTARVELDQALFAYKRARPSGEMGSVSVDPVVVAAAGRVNEAVETWLALLGELRNLGFDPAAVVASGRPGDGSAVDSEGRGMRIGVAEDQLGGWWRRLGNATEVEAAWRRYVVARRVADTATLASEERLGGERRQTAEQAAEADALRGLEQLGVTANQRAALEAATVWVLEPYGDRLLGGAPFDMRAVGPGGEFVLPDGNHLVVGRAVGPGQADLRGRVMAPEEEGRELFAGVVDFPDHDSVRITGNDGVYRQYRHGVDAWEGGRPLTGPAGSPDLLAARFAAGSDPVFGVRIYGAVVWVERANNADGGFVLTELDGARRSWEYGPDFRLLPPPVQRNALADYRAAWVELEEALAGYARVRPWEAVGSISVDPVVMAAAGRVNAAAEASVMAFEALRRSGYEGGGVLAPAEVGAGGAVGAGGRGLRIELDHDRLGDWRGGLNNPAAVTAVWRRYVVARLVADASAFIPETGVGTAGLRRREALAGMVVGAEIGLAGLGVPADMWVELWAATVWQVFEGGPPAGGPRPEAGAVTYPGEGLVPPDDSTGRGADQLGTSGRESAGDAGRAGAR